MTPQSPTRRLLCATLVLGLTLAVPSGMAAPEDQDVVKVNDGDNQETVTVPQGAALHVRLSSNATTGYSWRMLDGGGRLLNALDNGVYRPSPGGGIGKGGFTIFRFNAVRAGSTTLRFRYAQAGGGGDAGKTFTVNVNVTGSGPWPPPSPPKVVSVDDSDNQEQVTVPRNGTLEVTLKANPTTGYSWRVLSIDPSLLSQQGESQYTPFPSGGKMGVGGNTTFRFKAERAGSGNLTLTYRQAGNPDFGGKQYTLKIYVPK